MELLVMFIFFSFLHFAKNYYLTNDRIRSTTMSIKLKETVPKRNKAQKQISFHCTKEFSDLVHREKVRRGMSIQDMITTALTEYFARPTAEDLRQTHAQEERLAKKLEKHGRISEDEFFASPARQAQRFIDLCVKYFQRMPAAKRQILEEFIILDLKHYASSRLKQRD
jgi:hypothetical protein